MNPKAQADAMARAATLAGCDARWASEIANNAVQILAFGFEEPEPTIRELIANRRANPGAGIRDHHAALPCPSLDHAIAVAMVRAYATQTV